MYGSVQTVLKKYNQVWANSNPFKTNFNLFEANLTRLDEKELAQLSSKPATKGKKQALTNMLDNALLISSAGFAYSSTINDKKLKEAFNFTKSKLKVGKDLEIFDRCKLIAETADKIMDKLTDYNVTEAQLNLLNDCLKAYAENINQPRETLKSSKSSREEMFLLVDECDRILEEIIDKLMITYKAANADFYLEYTNARIIGGWKKKKEDEPKHA
jgi:hypothetical protein